MIEPSASTWLSTRPPTRSRASTSRTERPPAATSRAATSPEMPPPTTTTSTVDGSRRDRAAAGQQHLVAVETGECRDGLDRAGPHRVDEADVQDRDLAAPGPGVQADARIGQAVPGQVRHLQFACHLGHHVADRTG